VKYWYDTDHRTGKICVIETPEDKYGDGRRFLMANGGWEGYPPATDINRIYRFNSLREAIGVLKTKAQIKVTPTRW
jgi:hypothetical protein